MMREIKLYGHLGARFGRVFRFDVSTAAEAISALRANLEGFNAYMLKHSAPGFHVVVSKVGLGKEDLVAPCGSGSIKIIPAVAGSKRAGLFQVILGAALLVVGFFVASPALMKLGATLLLTGISTMLTAPPGSSSRERPENMPSYSFNGAVNTTAQGNPVPVCYGRLTVGSQVVSFGLSVEDIYARTDDGSVFQVGDGYYQNQGGGATSGGDVARWLINQL